MKEYPTKRQLRHLKKRGWKEAADGLAWQSPYDKYYFSPRMAVVRERRKEEA